jgi:hypothetical protein
VRAPSAAVDAAVAAGAGAGAGAVAVRQLGWGVASLPSLLLAHARQALAPPHGQPAALESPPWPPRERHGVCCHGAAPALASAAAAPGFGEHAPPATVTEAAMVRLTARLAAAPTLASAAAALPGARFGAAATASSRELPAAAQHALSQHALTQTLTAADIAAGAAAWTQPPKTAPEGRLNVSYSSQGSAHAHASVGSGPAPPASARARAQAAAAADSAGGLWRAPMDVALARRQRYLTAMDPVAAASTPPAFAQVSRARTRDGSARAYADAPAVAAPTGAPGSGAPGSGAVRLPAGAAHLIARPREFSAWQGGDTLRR